MPFMMTSWYAGQQVGEDARMRCPPVIAIRGTGLL
jgi:hypothetical protein